MYLNRRIRNGVVYKVSCDPEPGFDEWAQPLWASGDAVSYKELNGDCVIVQPAFECHAKAEDLQGHTHILRWWSGDEDAALEYIFKKPYDVVTLMSLMMQISAYSEALRQ